MDLSSRIRIRTAGVSDAEAILAIYAPYIQKTAITFEYDVPGLEDFRGRIARTLSRHAYLVAEDGGEVLGYAYAGPFGARAATVWSAEVSIYLREDVCKRGLGRRLYQTLEDVCRAQNILNLNAAITPAEDGDPYVTRNSVDFHAHLGYRQTARFHHCAYKFGRWYGLVWMEKVIGEHTGQPAPVIPFPALSPQALQSLGVSIP